MHRFANDMADDLDYNSYRSPFTHVLPYVIGVGADSMLFNGEMPLRS